MSSDPILDQLVPAAPGWLLEWPAIADALVEVAALEGCPQEPAFHGEGDVFVHSRMVCEALTSDPEWQALERDARRTLFWAAVLHDIGKPATTRSEGARITSRGHSRRGAGMARVLLWRLGMGIAEREEVAGLVANHLVPFHLLERDDPMRLATRVSLVTRCRRLALLARADANGRIAADVPRLLDNVALFAEFTREAGCLETPYPFASDHSRFLYFRRPGRDPAYAAHNDTRLTVTLMAGLPAAGKDTWIATNAPHLPQVSLDAIRRDLGVAPDDAQGAVIQEARERARRHLRAGEDFVWNATNLSRRIRGNCIDLFADYNARVRIVHLEAAPDTLAARNRARDAPVPDKTMARLAEHWQVPDLTEAHEVDLFSPPP